MDSEHTYKLEGIEIFIVRVKTIGNTGHVYVPKKYIGKKVSVVVHNG